MYREMVKQFHKISIFLIGMMLFPCVLCAQEEVQIIRPQTEQIRAPFRGLTFSTVKRPRVVLVLSGGGARGISAIGVLKVLEREHIPIDCIIGVSIGSVIGGLYAAGYSVEELETIADTTRWNEILNLSDEARREEMYVDQKIARERSIITLRFEGLEPVIPSAFSTGQRLTRYLNILSLNAPYHPSPSFNDLKIPFRAVATDLVSGERIVMDQGDLTTAIRASIAIPLLFTSVKKDTMQLLDGGLVDNIPVDVAMQEGADVIIAVDMSSALRPRKDLSTPWEMVDQITTIMMQPVSELSRSKADVVIRPNLGNRLSTDFSNIDSLISLGEEAAEAALPFLQNKIDDKWKIIEAENDSSIFYHPIVVCQDSVLLDSVTISHWQQQGFVKASELRFFLAKIADKQGYDSIEARVRRTKDSTFINIIIPTFFSIDSIELEGVTVFPIDSVRKFFDPLFQKPLNYRLLITSMESLISCYRAQGYSLARISAVDYDTLRAYLFISVDEGRIGRIDVRGNTKAKDWVVRREVPLKTGDLFTIQRAAQGISNLYATGLFEHVVLSIHNEESSQYPSIVTIEVRERSTALVRIGVRLDDERGFQPSVDIRDENFLGTATEIGIRAGGGERNQYYSADIKAIRIFNTYLTLGLQGYISIRNINVYDYNGKIGPDYFRRERIGEYRERRNGGALSFGTQLERIGNLLIAGRIEDISINNIFSETIAEQRYRLSALRISTDVDTQNKYPYPTSGVIMNLYYETANVHLGGDIGYTKFFFSYETYQAPIRTFTVHPKIVLGVGDDAVPVSEQFSLGGQTSFFGFRENDRRGRQLMAGSMELQYKLPFRIYVDTYFKIRYDLGGIWSLSREVRLADFNHGFGATLALDTPIGPVEFSGSRAFFLRQDVLKHPAAWGPWLFSFSIGYPLVYFNN